MLPKLGLQRGIYVAVLASWSWPACCSRSRRGCRARRRAASAAAVALALLGLVLPRWNLVTFSSGFFRVSIAREYI